jgi:hypothetical protein
MKLCDPKRRTIAQLIIAKHERADWIEVQELSETWRRRSEAPDWSSSQCSVEQSVQFQFSVSRNRDLVLFIKQQ